jgi:uncharacterized repeat protein (TIGR02543 family)
MSFAKDSEVPNYRAFLTTIDGTTVKTTYSYIQDFETVYEYASDLIISEYGEGGGSNKWIEIFNGTGSSVDLSSYSVELYSNGSATASETVTLSGTLASGDVYVIYNSGGTYDLTSVTNKLENNSVANFNGDDAVVLKKSGTVIDAIGQIGFDPGTAWTVNGVSTLNMTLVRMPSVISGDTDGSNVFDPSVEWIAHPQDTFTYIGSHTMTLSSSQSVLITTDYDSPNSINIIGNSSVNSNETIQLSSDVENVIWISSNENILTVDETGLITGVAEGSAIVYAYSYYNHSVYATHAVTVSEIQEYTVSFNSLGGSAVSSQLITGGEYATEPSDPTRSDYIFDGWYTSSDNGLTLDTLFDFSTTTITSDMTLYAKWAQATTIFSVRALTVGATVDYVEGIVTGLSGTTQNVYINDGTAAIVARNATLYGAVSVGDKVRLKTSTLGTYYGLLQLTDFTYEKLSSGNALPSTLSIADLSVLTSAYQAERISIDGLEVVSISGQNLVVTDGTTQLTVRSALTSGTIYDHLNTAIVGQTVNLVDIHVGWYNTVQVDPINVSEVVFVPLSDAELIQMDADALPTSLELTDNHVVPTPEYGSTYTVTAVSTELQANIDYTTTPGTLLVTRPAAGNPDLVGTVTIQVTLGTEEPIDVVISVTVKAEVEGSGQITYTQDFSSLTTATSSYSTSKQFTDANSFAWDLLGRQNVGSWMLGNAADGSYIQVTAQGGVSSISFDVVRAFTNINVRSGEVFVNGVTVGTFNVNVNSDIAQTITFENINVSGQVIIKIVTTSPGSRGAYNVDNITWNTNP